MKGVRARIQPGDQFERLTVLTELPARNRQRVFMCLCACGCEVITDSGKLLSGNTKSCGCLRKEMASMLKFKHGMNRTRIHRTWQLMKSRCLCPSDSAYQNYGGRGIGIYEPWLDFLTFYEWANSTGYSDNLTIERVNNDGNYEPSNCTWIPKSEQSKNRRSCVFLEHEGLKMTVSDWARKLGVKRETIKDRLRSGWSIARSLTEPVNVRFVSTKG